MKKKHTPLPLRQLGWASACLATLPWLISNGLAADSSALNQLFAQARYWHDRGHPEDANAALKKVLSVQPDNSDALYLLALYALERGNQSELDQWKHRLSLSAPGSQYLSELNEESQAKKLSPGKLDKAHSLARAGNPAEALTVYESLFNGAAPTLSLASEYYQVMAAVPERRGEAVTALQTLYEQNPGNNGIRLALGKLLTYQEETRREGISLLTGMGGAQSDAQKSLRQALLWLHPDSRDRQRYAQWRDEHPDDDEVAKHYSDNVTGSQIEEGFNTANAGKLSDASETFDNILQEDPDNSNALGGLGIIAMKQGDHEKAAALFRRAAAQKTADSQKWLDLAQQADVYKVLDEAKAFAAKREWDQALGTSAPLLTTTGDEKKAVELFRADVMRRSGDLAAAETAYRAIDSIDAKKGLYFVLKEENKNSEAQQLMADLPASFRHQLISSQPLSIEPLRREAQQSANSGDVEAAKATLTLALAKDPHNVWARLDLARLYQKAGDTRQAQLVLQPALQSGNRDGLYASALFQAENHQWNSALEYLNRIPSRAWDTSIRALKKRIDFNQRLTQAQAYLSGGGDRAEAAALLKPLAMQDPETPSDAGSLASELYQAGLTTEAVGVIHRNMRKGIRGSVGEYADQLDVLNQAGLSTEAEQWLAQPGLQERSSPLEFAKIKSGAAIRRADTLREAGQYAQAWDILMPKLQADPDNEGLMLAMARVYQSGKMFGQSHQIYDFLLNRDGKNQAAREGAINLALAEGDTDRAESLLQELAAPGTPEHQFLAARVAQSTGDNKLALTLLRSAKSQLQGLGTSGNEGQKAFTDNPFVDETPVSAAFNASPTLPWHREPEAKAANGKAAMLADVTKLLNETREKVASWAETTLGLRNRDGESGLSSLTETKTELAFSTVPFQDSRLKLAITPVMLNAGASTGQASNRFGTGALQQARGSWAATQNSLQASNDSVKASEAARQALEQKSNERINACQSPTSAECGLAMKAETEAQDAYNLAQQHVIQPQKFGPDDFAAASSGSQQRSGAEIALSLAGDNYKADIGTTPLGQGTNRLLGGLRWSPLIAGNTHMTLNVERRAVTDSLLSYVGTKDKYTGKRWGGVNKTGGGLSLNYDDGKAGSYGGVSYYQYQGENVADNSAVIANAGLYVRPLATEDREVKVGINADYMDFKENLSNFSFGQGGYFSPQDYISLSLPVSYSRRAQNWDYELSGSVGYQSYSQKQSDYFPTNSDWQHNLDWLVNEGYGRESHYAAKTSKGVSYNVNLHGNYKLNPQLSVGGALGYDTVGEYSEANAQLFFRYLFDDQ